MEEIMQGESKSIEFKSELPKKSERYMKSIIAFSNTSGGKLLVGIEDETGNIIGVKKDEVFQIMDSIANAISDSCEPQIIPDITVQNLDGKSVVIIGIYPGANRPYYLKSLGKEHGTFIRIAGTSRPADPIKIKELELEGSNLSWDELTCIGYEVTDDSIEKLCNDMYSYMINAVSTEEEKKDIPKVTKEQLFNWKILKNIDGKLMATNAFVLLTSDYFPFAKIQCALFKGTDRDEFIDKKDYTGPLYEQIEQAYQFVLRHINKQAIIEDLIRKERYELPVGAIREMIINAECHRNYLDPSCVQVALYDDRLEITSPGMLFGGLTLEEAMSGRSKIRNRIIAEAFSRMDLVEEWGTGIRRIIKRAKEHGLPEPDFLEIGDTFRVNLFRSVEKKPIKKADKPIKKADKPIKKADKIYDTRKQTVRSYIQKHGAITNKEARELFNLADSTTKRILKQMVLDGMLVERGSNKARIYIFPASEREI